MIPESFPHRNTNWEPNPKRTTLATIPSLPSLFNDNFFLGFADQVARWQTFTSAKPSSFPPYNIIKENDDNYRVELAVAGYSKSDVEINVERDQLVVASAKTESDDAHYVHQGIAERSWKQTFILGEYMVVKDATLKDGLLTISVERELPEELKPRTIKIK